MFHEHFIIRFKRLDRLLISYYEHFQFSYLLFILNIIKDLSNEPVRIYFSSIHNI